MSKPSFPWPLVACAIVLAAGLYALKMLRVTEKTETPVTNQVQIQHDETGSSPEMVPGDNESNADPGNPSAQPGETNTLAQTGHSATPASSSPSTSSSTSTSQQDEDATQKEKPPKHFTRSTEQLLAMMLSTPADCEMPPLPALDPNDAKLNADAILALTNDLVIYETDDERLVELKEAVAALKEQLAEAVKSGGNVADVLNEFRNWQNEGVKVRNETIKAINEIKDDGDAAKALDDANKTLKEEGVVPIRPEEVGFDTGDDEEE